MEQARACVVQMQVDVAQMVAVSLVPDSLSGATWGRKNKILSVIDFSITIKVKS